MFRVALVALPIIVAASAAFADTPTPTAPAIGKRQACKDMVKSKDLRGMERMDAMQLCIAEGRLDCVKDAIAKKIARDERKQFLKECLTGASAKNDDKMKDKDHEQDKDDDKDDDDK